ncbi:MAG: DNA polymerase III subunit delta [Deltaproteobacteria bacterium]|nr:DNA polymerase III subunit delta [Deltaproteobacteria bacterium]
MDIAQLDSELRLKKWRPCYLLVGEERHLLLTAQRQILTTILKDQEEPDRFNAGECGMHKILDCLGTPSLLAEWRLVLVEEADQFKKKDWEALSAFLKNPPPNAVLVLEAESLSKTELKYVPPSAAVVDCKKLYPDKVAAWINIEARHLKIPISFEAAKLLADCIGNELGAVRQALEKLILFVGERKIIQLEDVEQVVANSAQRTVFNLTDAIGQKKPELALQYLDRILDGGVEPVKAFVMIVRHFRLLAKAGEVLATSGPDAPFAKMLGVNPFFVKGYVAQTRHFRPTGWPRRFARLSLCDRALKSSRMKPQMVLEKLIFDLCKD